VRTIAITARRDLNPGAAMADRGFDDDDGAQKRGGERILSVIQEIERAENAGEHFIDVLGFGLRLTFVSAVFSRSQNHNDFQFP